MINRDNSPWCTRAEASTYLRLEGAETIDGKLTKAEAFTPGKIRYKLMLDHCKRNKPRLWKSDVLAMLAPFED